MKPRILYDPKAKLYAASTQGTEQEALASTKQMLDNFQSALMKYRWGASTVPTPDIITDDTLDIMNKLMPVLSGDSKTKALLFFEDTRVSEEVVNKDTVTTGNTTILRFKESDLYDKLDEYAQIAKQSIPFIFQYYYTTGKTSSESSSFEEWKEIGLGNYSDVIHYNYRSALEDLDAVIETDTNIAEYGKNTDIVDGKAVSIGSIKNKIIEEHKLFAFLRLYPSNVSVSYPSANVQTTFMSDNRLLQTTHSRKNLIINIGGNLALNTLDTQWFDAYATFFDYWVSNGNKPLTLILGNYIINNCYVLTPPVFTNSLKKINFFNLTLVSSINNIDSIK